jgi:hypothetical protein
LEIRWGGTRKPATSGERSTKRITSAVTFKGYTVRASKEDPQYLIKSDTTDHLAMHKGAALKKLKGKQ